MREIRGSVRISTLDECLARVYLEGNGPGTTGNSGNGAIWRQVNGVWDRWAYLSLRGEDGVVVLAHYADEHWAQDLARYLDALWPECGNKGMVYVACGKRMIMYEYDTKFVAALSRS